MGLFQKLKDGLKKTQSTLAHEIKRIVTLSPKLTKEGSDDLEAALLGADLGLTMTQRILGVTKKAYETQGRDRVDIFGIAAQEVENALSEQNTDLHKEPDSITVVS